ncbi:hypothetical protein AOLI_G00258480 [Acnodon oligacanthus]
MSLSLSACWETDTLPLLRGKAPHTVLQEQREARIPQYRPCFCFTASCVVWRSESVCLCHVTSPRRSPAPSATPSRSHLLLADCQRNFRHRFNPCFPIATGLAAGSRGDER